MSGRSVVMPTRIGRRLGLRLELRPIGTDPQHLVGKDGHGCYPFDRKPTDVDSRRLPFLPGESALRVDSLPRAKCSWDTGSRGSPD